MKIIHYMAILLELLMAVVLLWVNYSLFWPVQTLDIKNFTSPGVVSVSSSTYQRGTPLGYVLDYCKTSNYPVKVNRTLVDGQIIILSNSTGYLPLGCHKTLVQTAVVPDSVAPGEYYLDVDVIYTINVFRTEEVHYRTNTFMVTK